MMIMDGGVALNLRHTAWRLHAVLFAVLVGLFVLLSQTNAQTKSSEDTSFDIDDRPHHDHTKFYKSSGGDGRETCERGGGVAVGIKKEGECPGTGPRLVRLEGEKVGHVEELELVPGKTHLLKTINMKPVIFEIPAFFTSDECRHIISLAKEQGLQNSATTSVGSNGALSLKDVNGDQKLSLREIQLTLEGGYDIFLDDDDVKKMYAELGVDLDNDGFLSRSEVTRKSIGLIRSYVMKLKEEQPIKKSRFSEQTWIYPDKTEDPLVTSFQDRISKLTRLPRLLIDKFSYFQVVHYGKHGHYNAHHDSSFIDDLTCCHLTETKKCRICRYMTIMVYLNSVEEGGETAFPVANDDNYDMHVFHQTGKMNLNARCQESNLKIQPEQGKAVIWYNHFINETTGWLGDIDPFTWHGGCPVTKGHKWIMNRWIAVSDSREADLGQS